MNYKLARELESCEPRFMPDEHKNKLFEQWNRGFNAGLIKQRVYMNKFYCLKQDAQTAQETI